MKIVAIAVPQEELDRALKAFEIAEKNDFLSDFPKALRAIAKELIARTAKTEKED
ncbi:hypothetical protein GN109_05650 [Collimonas pratensis]|uniref:hypothetical protein n=1 Tax=Collimonas pratensis TaxID=279113 RepID=UPI00143DF18E|nr:hypothetical protein [Collimonas pratensis]NKI68898.1 hypothetical protein [Collimonas pratensis]